MSQKDLKVLLRATMGHRPNLMILGVDCEFELAWPSVEYQPDAPARVFPFRRKDLRRPSLARGVGMEGPRMCQATQMAIRLFWDDANQRRFLRSECPERVGRSLAEVLTGIPHPHGLTLLGFTRFQRA